MIMIHECTMLVVHVSCPTGLMFGAVEVAGSKGAKPPEKAGDVGDRQPPSDRVHRILVSPNKESSVV